MLALHDADEMALELYRDGHEPPEPEEHIESPELLDHLEVWLSEQYTNGKTRAEYKSVILGLHRWLEEQSVVNQSEQYQSSRRRATMSVIWPA